MKQNVIIIEENAAVRYVLTNVLQKKFRISEFDNCFEASEELKNTGAGLILVNIDTYNSDNIDFVNHLKSSSLYRNIPVIAILRKDDEILKQLCLNTGAEQVFVKPFDPRLLLGSVEELLPEAFQISNDHNEVATQAG
ncbi:MAG: response regulator [Chitinophagaceae bacterium]|mgnify:CR=1 FL=1|jgi:DNA-binding response OmpR family regulator|nr:MAG: hypothetical protein BGO52_17850 [Sphingobacteriales bacterium 44-61]TXJ28334.1 MAG: response regulator [Chitinophagaceae bacterium]